MTENFSSPIIIKNLVKSYDTVKAVNGVSFDVKPGEVFGLIGPDGAGKTSIIRILVSLLRADSGQVLFEGKEVSQNPAFVRSHIGYMPQRFSLYPDLTVDENLNFFGDLFAIPKNEQIHSKEKLFEFSKLGSFKERRAGQLSGGMKQKLALSCMLMHAPKVIVLDEPTFGVDPVSRQEFWEILKSLAAEGTSILVTTAYMDEARLCDRVGLIFEGNILAIDTPDKLVAGYKAPLYLIRSDNPHLTYENLADSALVADVDLFGDGVHFTDTNKIGQQGLADELTQLGISADKIEEIEPDMEDLFIALMKR